MINIKAAVTIGDFRKEMGPGFVCFFLDLHVCVILKLQAALT